MEEMPMNIDHKKPENRPLYIFALIAVVVILFLNIFAIPAMQERSVEKTDYSTFLSNVERGNVSKAEVQGQQYQTLYEIHPHAAGNFLLPVCRAGGALHCCPLFY